MGSEICIRDIGSYMWNGPFSDPCFRVCKPNSSQGHHSLFNEDSLEEDSTIQPARVRLEPGDELSVQASPVGVRTQDTELASSVTFAFMQSSTSAFL